MSDMDDTAPSEHSGRERKRQKIRIRFKERVRLKDRPRGYHIKRFLRKQKHYVIMALLAVSTAVVVLVWVTAKNAEKEKARKERKERIYQDKLLKQKR